ncbi:transposase [Streptomyces sp. NPDC001732]
MLGSVQRPMQLSRCPLSLRARSGEQVPSLTARMARASNPGGTTAMWVRDHLGGLWRDEDFADWYPCDGRPGLSPAQLATVCVLQFLLGLSDRQAAEAVRCRIDFKYALATELDDPGFHHSVLGDFRERLAEDGRADRLLDLALARLREAGLVRERTTQRTDFHPCPGRGARPDPAGTGHRGRPRRAGRAGRRRSAPADRPGRRGVGAPLRPPGASGQEPYPSQDQDPRHRRRRRPADRAPRAARAGTPVRAPRPGPAADHGAELLPRRGPAACAGAPRRTAACRPRPSRSSRPTTRRPATRAAAMSPDGRGSSRISPRPAIPTGST